MNIKCLIVIVIISVGMPVLYLYFRMRLSTCNCFFLIERSTIGLILFEPRRLIQYSKFKIRDSQGYSGFDGIRFERILDTNLHARM